MVMPAKTAKQYNFMQAVLHKPGGSDKIGGPSKRVAKEFVDKTPSKKKSMFMKKGVK